MRIDQWTQAERQRDLQDFMERFRNSLTADGDKYAHISTSFTYV